MSEIDRNLRGHAEAIAARWLWSHEYAVQGGGQLDFYDALPNRKKRLVQEMVDAILSAPAGRATRIGKP
ncbi:MAG: hypothetical protein ACR2QF_00360 [Geminicoccaceae bacterium]